MPKMKPKADFTKPFVVSDRVRELAKEHGWLDPDSEVDAFIDYHEAGGWKLKNGLKIVDREASFRTWLRNGSKYAKQAPRPNGYVPLPTPAAKRKVIRFEPEMTEEQRRENVKKLGAMFHDLADKFDVRKKV